MVQGSDGRWKLLNLGNSTTKFYGQVQPEDRYQIDLEIERTTQQLFRAPELLDLYSLYPINEKMDVFSLGCLLYQLLFFKSAFQLDLKLDQMNARFHIPTSSTASKNLTDILTQMLEADPSRRISCAEAWSVLDSLGDV